MSDEDKPKGGTGSTNGAGDPKSAAAAAADEPESGEESERPSKRRSEPPAAAAGPGSAPPPADVREKAAWGAPLARLDRGWTTLESRLCAAVLVAEVVTLVFWIAIRAMSSTGSGGAGLIFRSLLTALVFGVGAHFATRRHERHELFTTLAALLGLV